MKVSNTAFKGFAKKWSKVAMDASEEERGTRLHMIGELAKQLRNSLGPDDVMVLASALKSPMATDGAVRFPHQNRLSPNSGRSGRPTFIHENRLKVGG